MARSQPRDRNGRFASTGGRPGGGGGWRTADPDDGADTHDADAQLAQARELAQRSKALSTAQLRRRLRVGPARARQLMAQLEHEGAVKRTGPGTTRKRTSGGGGQGEKAAGGKAAGGKAARSKKAAATAAAAGSTLDEAADKLAKKALKGLLDAMRGSSK